MSPTSFLDDRAAMEGLDSQHSLLTIEQLGSQVQQIWDLAQSVKFSSQAPIKKVVVAGMGGSVLGTHVIQTLFADQLNVPITIAPDYTVPAYVDAETLVIGASYSGNTEETLAAVQDAHAKGAQLAGITTGGKLETFLKEKGAPVLVFEPTFNPSQIAKMGLGYSIFGQMALLAAAGIIKVTQQDMEDVLEAIASAHLQMSAQIPQQNNLAKVLAFQMTGRIPVVTTAEHLEGMAHVFANQLNENSKTFAEYRVIPELNHHLMEGLKFPPSNSSDLLFVILDSKLYNPRNRRRIEVFEEVLEQHDIEFVRHTLSGKTKIAQNFELLVMAAYASFYLAMIHNENPTPIPVVDWFKSQL
jgi:glucose/mannose-6-phosphate isomerase